MKYINDYGIIYRMTNKQFRKFIEEGVKGLNPLASSYGKLVCVIDFTVDNTSELVWQLAIENEE